MEIPRISVLKHNVQPGMRVNLPTTDLSKRRKDFSIFDQDEDRVAVTWRSAVKVSLFVIGSFPGGRDASNRMMR